MEATMRTTGRTGTAAARPTGWRRSSACPRFDRGGVMKRNWIAAALALLVPALAAAQGFPSKTIRIVSGVTPGRASHTMARIPAEKLSPVFGPPASVENRLGAGGRGGGQDRAVA